MRQVLKPSSGWLAGLRLMWKRPVPDYGGTRRPSGIDLLQPWLNRRICALDMGLRRWRRVLRTMTKPTSWTCGPPAAN